MKFEYPVKSKDGTIPHHLTAGYYPIGMSNTWHGGVHIEGDLRAIQNIADGEIIAYKISSKYIEDRKKAKKDGEEDIVSYYSDSFVLVRHKYSYAEKKVFTFYSLYCHLQIQEEITDSKYPIFAKKYFKIKSSNEEKIITGVNLRTKPSVTATNVIGVVTDKKVNHLSSSGNWRKINAIVWKSRVNSHEVIFEKAVESSEGYYSNRDSVKEGMAIISRNDDSLKLKCEILFNTPNGTKKEFIPIDSTVEVLDKNGEWFKIKTSKVWHKDTIGDSKIVYRQKDEEVEGWCRNTNNQFDGYIKVKYGTIESVSIPVEAGAVIGYSGKYRSVDGRLLAGYCGAHVEVFSNDDVPAFLKDMKEKVINENKVYEKERLQHVLITTKNKLISYCNYFKNLFWGESECVCKKYDLIWGAKVSCEFRKKVVQICEELWGEEKKIEMANGLMAVMAVETSNTFKSCIIAGQNQSTIKQPNEIVKDDFWNKAKTQSKAVGLIQFTQQALETIGEFKRGSGFDKLHSVKLRFAQMDEVTQLGYVKKYFQKCAYQKCKSPEDIYLMVFAPIGIAKSDDTVLYSKSKAADKYNANKSVDTNKNEEITRKEILARYKRSYQSGKTQKASCFECSNMKNEGQSAQDEKQSIIRLVRKWEYKATTHEASSTISEFTIDDDELTGYFLEPYGGSTTQSGQDKRIPTGEYNLTWHTSTKFSKDKYSKKKKGKELKNGFPKLYNSKVSALRGILIHIGNKGKDSEGCLLPGNNITVEKIGKKKCVTAVTGSTIVFYQLISYIESKGIENIKLVITEKYEEYK